VVILGISGLTILVESTSSVWPPGTRTPMLEQVLEPLLYSSALFGLTCLAARLRTLQRVLRLAGISVLCAAVFLLGLEHNRLQALTTRYFKKWLLASVRELKPYTDRPLHIVLKLPTLGGRPFDVVFAQHYLQQCYRSRMLNAVVLQRQNPIAAWLRFTDLAFLSDEQGILMRGADGKKTLIRYDEVVLAQSDGHTTLLKNLTAADVEGFEAQFTRSRPIAAAELPLMRTFARRVP
jgi:hypothetical protein